MNKAKFKPKKYLVYIASLYYPSQGYYVNALRITKGVNINVNTKEVNIYDFLPASMIDHAIIEASNISEAKAKGLQAFYKKAENNKTDNLKA